MRVFISWSGHRGKHVAVALRNWLPDIIQAITPWMSETDIPAGAEWLAELRRELSEESFGIICVTRERATAPWMMFEAGALAKSVQNARVCPYVIDMGPGDIPPGPLTVFQAKRADREGTLALMRSINERLETGKGQLPPDRFDRAFETHWPALEDKLGNLPAPTAPTTPARTMEDKMDEILQLVRVTRQEQPLTRERLEQARRAQRSLTELGQLARPSHLPAFLQAASNYPFDPVSDYLAPASAEEGLEPLNKRRQDELEAIQRRRKKNRRTEREDD